MRFFLFDERFKPNRAKTAARIDNSTAGTFTRRDLTVSSKEERKGNAVRDKIPIPQLPPQL
jgi:hypothetical protein